MHIVQIMGGGGWFAHSRDKTGDYWRPLVAWAIDEERGVIGLVVLEHDAIAREGTYVASARGEDWIGYVHARDTPEGQRRRKNLEKIDGHMMSETGLASVGVLSLVDEMQAEGDDPA